MSIHKSLKPANAMARTRSVYTRAERLAILKLEGRHKDGDHAYGIPKTRVAKPLKRGKKKKAEEATTEGAA